jgi:hypothetical protein
VFEQFPKTFNAVRVVPFIAAVIEFSPLFFGMIDRFVIVARAL